MSVKLYLNQHSIRDSALFVNDKLVARSFDGVTATLVESMAIDLAEALGVEHSVAMVSAQDYDQRIKR